MKKKFLHGFLIALMSMAPLSVIAQDEQADEGAEEGASLTGMVFQDDNKNGLREPDEIGGAGIIVDLLDSEGEFMARVLTDENGLYAFQGLEDGVYFLRFEFSVGFAIRSRGVAVEGNAIVFSPVPIITPDSNLNFIRLNLMNPANFRGEEVSAFAP